MTLSATEAVAEQRFDDYFIYSYISKYYKKTPLEVFLVKMLFKYPPDNQKILSGFTGHILVALVLVMFFRDSIL